MEVKNKDQLSKHDLNDCCVQLCRDRWVAVWWLVLAMGELGYLVFMAACALLLSVGKSLFVIYSACWIVVVILVLWEVKAAGKRQVQRLQLNRGEAGERSE